MNEVTRILSAVGQGNPHAAKQLLPLVYEELRKLAAQKMAQEAPGQTLQPTALVHEAYLRLVGGERALRWDGRRQFVRVFAGPQQGLPACTAARQQRRQGERHDRVPHGSSSSATGAAPSSLPWGLRMVDTNVAALPLLRTAPRHPAAKRPAVVAQ
jgi:hypothetical protein